MMEKLKKPTLWLAVLGVTKLLAQAFGVEIEDELINMTANGLAGLFTIIGVFVDHGKAK